jgi:hypothetical protein
MRRGSSEIRKERRNGTQASGAAGQEATKASPVFEYQLRCNGRLGLWVYSTMNLMYSLRGRDGSLELSELREPE